MRYVPLSLAILVACGGEDTPAPIPPECSTPIAGTQVTFRLVAETQGAALLVTSPPNDPRRYVVEQEGRIKELTANGLSAPVLTISDDDDFACCGEQGLLGLAFFPDYASSGRFIVHYIDLSGDTRVSLLRVSGDPDRADPASESVLLTVPQPGVAHKGGQVLFGPDGFLYVGLGDGDDDDHGNGQSLNDLLGSILRIDVSSGDSYAIPPDNPFMGTTDARPEIWSYGFRNPWRFTFDRGTGDLYIGDVGESEWEEVDFASGANGAGRGVNYGWSRMEGLHCSRGQVCDQTGLALPVVEYSHSDGCSVIGGYVYRGAAMPALQGKYFYSDYCSGWVRSFQMEAGVAVDGTDWPELSPEGQVTSFGEDAVGELYLVTAQGSVFKVVPR